MLFFIYFKVCFVWYSIPGWFIVTQILLLVVGVVFAIPILNSNNNHHNHHHPPLPKEGSQWGASQCLICYWDIIPGIVRAPALRSGISCSIKTRAWSRPHRRLLVITCDRLFKVARFIHTLNSSSLLFPFHFTALSVRPRTRRLHYRPENKRKTPWKQEQKWQSPHTLENKPPPSLQPQAITASTRADPIPDLRPLSSLRDN